MRQIPIPITPARSRAFGHIHSRRPVPLVWVATIVALAAIGWFSPAASGQLARRQPVAPIPIYVEDSPAAVELAAEAKELAARGDRAEAVRRLGQMLQRYPGKLMASKPGLYVDVVTWVRQYLRSETLLLEAYRRYYQPIAHREYQLALAPRADARRLESVVRKFLLTPSGLLAALDLVSLYLERADPRAAISVLDELPGHGDLHAHAQRYHQLAAVAGLLDADLRRQALHQEKLIRLGFRATAKSIDNLAARWYRPEQSGYKPVVENCVAYPQVEIASAPLWQYTLPYGNARRVTVRLNRGRMHLGSSAAATGQVTGAPAVSDRQVFINRGHQILALQRHSGRKIWSFAWVPPASPDAQPKVVRRMLGRWGLRSTDRRGVLLLHNKALAVLGQATSWTHRRNLSRPTNALVCLDQQTGQLLWQVEPKQLQAGLAQAHFVGTPLADHERICVLMRRIARSGFTDSFLVAVAADSGRSSGADICQARQRCPVIKSVRRLR